MATTLPFEVLDLLDRAVGEDHVFLRIIAVDAVLQLVGDDPQVVQSGILDSDRKRGERQVGDFEFAVGQRRDHLRRAHVAHGLEHIGLVPGEILLFQQERGPVGDRSDP